MSGLVTHFEIYGDEPAKLAAFYRELFGWRIEPAAGVDYWRIHLGSPANGAAAGGLAHPPLPGARGWMQYVKVESLDHSLAAAQRLGGRVVREKMAVPKTAWYAVIADPQGNLFAIWQPDRTAFPEPVPD